MEQVLWKILDVAARNVWGQLETAGTLSKERSLSLQHLFDEHFQRIGQPNHVCRPTLWLALENLQGKSAIIIETGSAAHGTKSSVLFDDYICTFGGTLYSVDNRAEPMLKARDQCSRNSVFFCDDSVSFFKTISNKIEKADLIYLDSWDLDLEDPLPAAIHGFNEFIHALPLVKTGTLLLIDDTPKSFENFKEAHGNQGERQFESFRNKYGFNPGKGSLVEKYLQSNQVGETLSHQYQFLYRF